MERPKIAMNLLMKSQALLYFLHDNLDEYFPQLMKYKPLMPKAYSEWFLGRWGQGIWGVYFSPRIKTDLRRTTILWPKFYQVIELPHLKIQN